MRLTTVALVVLAAPVQADTAPRCAALAAQALSTWTAMQLPASPEAADTLLDRLTNLVALHNAVDCQSGPLAQAMDCVRQRVDAGGEAGDLMTRACLQRADLMPPD